MYAESLILMVETGLQTVESELTHGNPGGITRHMLQCLHMWCAQQYTLVLIAAGRLQAAKQFLQQVSVH